MRRSASVASSVAPLALSAIAWATTCTAAIAAEGASSATLSAPAWPSRSLAIPVDHVLASQLHDTFRDGRPGHRHEALDIAAPRGTKVFAVDDGTVAKLFTSVPGGLTVYQFDVEGRVAYYYAHLDRYADGLKNGKTLHRCDLIGYVGTTGNAAADAPHLHFAVFRLGPERRWWEGTALDPLPALKMPCG